MANVVHNTGYVAEGLGRLPLRFQGLPRIAALLTAWLNEAQAVEDAFYQIYSLRLLQNGVATGDLLAKLGKIVGQGSEGQTDPVYLLLITAKIRANRSNGNRADLIDVVSLLVPSTTIYVKDFPPASVYVEPQGAVTVPPIVVVNDFLKPTVAAGVRVTFVWSSAARANSLIFGSVHGTTPTVAQSPGSVHGGTGGALSGARTIDGGP